MAVTRSLPLGSITLYICNAPPTHSASAGDHAVNTAGTADTMLYHCTGGTTWTANGTGGGGGGGAPTTADYLVKTADAGLSAERVVTDTASLVWNWATAGQAKADVQFGSTGTTACVGNDARLSNARTPTAHASTHASAGSDPVTPAAIGAADATHTHAESDITNLVSDLAGKAPTVHTHAAADVTSGTFATARIPHLPVRTTANVALAASTTVNITALDITVANGDVWVLDYMLPVTVSGGTAGLKPIFTLPASSTGVMDVSGTVAAVTGYSFTHSTTPTTAAAVAFMTASFTGYIYVRAVLTMGAAGTCRIGLTTGASAAGNILAGASVLAMKV